MATSKNEGAQLVSVSGGKGGIGKTFFSVNFGVELVNLGYRVLIFDADVNFSNVNLLTHVNNSVPFHDFLSGEVSIHKIIQKGMGGVDVLYAGEDLNYLLKFDTLESENLFLGLKELQNQYDYIIVDMPAGMNELLLTLISVSSRVIMVTNSDIAALSDLYRTIKLSAARTPNIVYDLVVNKANSGEEAAKVFDNIKSALSKFSVKGKLSFLGFILNDSRQVIFSIQKRTPLVLLYQSSKLRACFELTVKRFLKGSRRLQMPFVNVLLEKMNK